MASLAKERKTKRNRRDAKILKNRQKKIRLMVQKKNEERKKEEASAS